MNNIALLRVLNKSDLVSKEEMIKMRRGFDGIDISAINKKTLRPLSDKIMKILF